MTVGHLSSSLNIKHSTHAFKAQPIRRIDSTAKPPGQQFALSYFFTMHKHCLEDLNQVCLGRPSTWLHWGYEQLSPIPEDLVETFKSLEMQSALSLEVPSSLSLTHPSLLAGGVPSTLLLLFQLYP